MSAFLYYVPESKIGKGGKLTIEELHRYGLSHVFEDPPTSRPVYGGPDNMNGVLMSARNDAAKYKYDGDSQTWTEMGEGSEVWMGYWADDKPTPDDLQRDVQLTGEWIRADDGSRWLAAHARQWVIDGADIYSSCKLPQRYTLNADGEWISGGVKSRCQYAWDLVLGYESAMAAGTMQDGAWRFSYDRVADLAIAALRLNYQVDKYELNALGIFDQEFMDSLISTIRDEKTYIEWSKKKVSELALDGGSSASGQEPSTTDSEPNTDQPAPTSAPGKTDSTEREPDLVGMLFGVNQNG